MSRPSKAPNDVKLSPATGHTLTTLADYCRGRSYLISARNHGIRPIDAIHHALTGNPWLPTASTP